MDVDEDKDPLLEELETSFDDYSISVDTKHLEKSSVLCKRYGLSAENFVETWLAYAASNGVHEITIETLGLFEQKQLATLKKVSSKVNHAPSIAEIKIKTEVPTKVEIFGDVSSSRLNSDSDPEIENVDELDPVLQAYGFNSANTVTPKTEKKVNRQQKPDIMLNTGNMLTPAGFSPAVQLKSTSYSARGRAGDSVLRYKCKDSDYWNEISDNCFHVKVFPAQSTKYLLESGNVFKYMFQKTPDMSSTLNDTLFDLALSIWNIFKDEELQDLRESSVVDGWYLGKICSTEGKLTPGSIYLEGDIDISGGHIVLLDLSTIEEYRLFSGQTVLVKGQNELGKCLRVSEVIHPAPLPMCINPKTMRPLNIIVACGPYTPTDSMLYEPLGDLLDVIKRDKPDVCILMGPFIDSSHPMIVDGYIAETFDELFDKMIEKLRLVKEEVKTHIVLVSSYKDAHHHPVYPTPPYSIKYVDKITVLPDPSVIEVGGITIGLTSTDTLLHLAGNEIAKSTVSDRMSGLSKHILSQHNFYPLYPPEESVPLDVQLASKYCKFLETTPHIIVMPSDLRYFIKEVEGTIVVNPEKLTKFRSGGTYARLQVKLPENFEGNSVADFCCGEIIKI